VRHHSSRARKPPRTEAADSYWRPFLYLREARGLDCRPLDEPLWTSLRRMFDDVVHYMSDPARAADAAELQRVINGSPSLCAAYLDRMLGNQSRIADAARERARDAGHGWDDADPAPLASVGAAFACLTAAHASAAAGGGPLGEALDRAMAAVGPLTCNS